MNAGRLCKLAIAVCACCLGFPKRLVKVNLCRGGVCLALRKREMTAGLW
jgi:uncharacterized membrane protein